MRCFLYHTIKAGMDLGIVMAGAGSWLSMMILPEEYGTVEDSSKPPPMIATASMLWKIAD